MRLRAGERWNWKRAKKTLAESRKFDPAIDQVYGKLLAEVYFRLDQAMQAFFRRVAAGATTLLLTGESTVEAISAELGYADVRSFRRFFKNATGLTPQEARLRSGSAALGAEQSLLETLAAKCAVLNA